LIHLSVDRGVYGSVEEYSRLSFCPSRWCNLTHLETRYSSHSLPLSSVVDVSPSSSSVNRIT